MSGKLSSPEEIISKLREAEVFLAEGVKVGEVIRRLGVNKITYYLPSSGLYLENSSAKWSKI